MWQLLALVSKPWEIFLNGERTIIEAWILSLNFSGHPEIEVNGKIFQAGIFPSFLGSRGSHIFD